VPKIVRVKYQSASANCDRTIFLLLIEFSGQRVGAKGSKWTGQTRSWTDDSEHRLPSKEVDCESGSFVSGAC